MTDISICPVCDGKEFAPQITTRDYSVSQEVFTIQRCATCGLLVTAPRPNDHQLGRYYESANYISHADEPKTLLDKIYWIARQTALKRKYALIKKRNTKTLLDFGCGTGTFLVYCEKKGIKVTGVEPSPNARTIAQSKTAAIRIHPSINEIEETFDSITLWHVLEHVPSLNQTIDDLIKRLSPNGTMFVAVPNVTSWDSTHYGPYWAAYDTPRHLWHFSPETITKLFSRHRLALAETVPMKLDSYYVSLLSEKYVNPKKHFPFGIINAVRNGFISNHNARKTGSYSSLIYIFKHA